MIEALISGKLHGKPERRMSKSGNPFVTAKVRVPTGDDAAFVAVVAFADTVQSMLLALDESEAVSLAGTLTADAWTDRDGKARPSLSLVANTVLTVHHAKRKREAAQQQRGEASTRQRDEHDHGPDDCGPDPWMGASGGSQ